MNATRRRLLAAGTGVAGALAGCGTPRPLTTPMLTLADDWGPGRRTADPRRAARTLIAFLPGIYDVPEDFERFGFFGEVRRRALAADLLAVDAHVGYFRERTVAERLRDEIVVPAHARGERRVWLVGVSLGGLGALLAAALAPGVAGVVAIAPFLATPDLAEEVRRAGGLRDWRPGPIRDDDALRPLLAFLRERERRTADARRALPRLVVGWGRDDRYADTLDAVFAGGAADERIVVPGGHDWPAWRDIWRRVLDAHGREIVAP